MNGASIVARYKESATGFVIALAHGLLLFLRGVLGLPGSQLDLKKIRDEAKRITGALHIRIKNNSVPLDYVGRDVADDQEGRERIERRVVEELIIRDNRFKTRADEIAGLVIGVKSFALNDEAPEKIAEAIAKFV